MGCYFIYNGFSKGLWWRMRYLKIKKKNISLFSCLFNLNAFLCNIKQHSLYSSFSPIYYSFEYIL